MLMVLVTTVMNGEGADDSIGTNGEGGNVLIIINCLNQIRILISYF